MAEDFERRLMEGYERSKQRAEGLGPQEYIASLKVIIDELQGSVERYRSLLGSGYTEFGLKMDCEANDCMEKFGHLHSDTDRVMTGYWDGRFGPVLDPGDLPDKVNNHKTKVVQRWITAWEDSPLSPTT